MKINPTGRLVPTPQGVDIVLTRSIRGPISDVWASVTESERTARWFGRWEGDPQPGGMIRVQMGFEEGDAWSDARIDACDPPSHLALSTSDAAGEWHLEITLEAQGDTTELTFTHHRDNSDGAGEIGPGWEYYLDNLIASRESEPLPDFNDYFPALQDHYVRQIAAAEPR